MKILKKKRNLNPKIAVKCQGGGGKEVKIKMARPHSLNFEFPVTFGARGGGGRGVKIKMAEI